MNESADSPTRRPAKPSSDRRVKLGFLAAAAALALVVYVALQRNPPILKDWPDDLDKAVAQSKQDGHKLLVLFMSRPPGQVAKRLAKTTLRKAHNRKAIADGKILRVKVQLDTSLTDELAKRHKIRKLPTMVLLSPTGVELNRREGMVGELLFRKGFLDCAEILKPTGP